MSPLLRTVGQGRGTFEAFVADSGDRLLRLAVVVATDVPGREDLYQECLVRLSRRWDRVDNPGAYCRRVIHNLAVDRSRTASRRREVTVGELPAVTDCVADAGFGAADVRPALFAALATLSAEHRVVVALRYLEDRSEAEVAEILGLPVGTVKSTASRALARLRRHSGIAHLFAAEAAS